MKGIAHAAVNAVNAQPGQLIIVVVKWDAAAL